MKKNPKSEIEVKCKDCGKKLTLPITPKQAKGTFLCTDCKDPKDPPYGGFRF